VKTLGPEARFVLRLAFVQAGVPLLSTGLTLVLAPRALLLDPTDLSLAVGSWAVIAVLIALVQSAMTFLFSRRLMPALAALLRAEPDLDARGLARLDALPARLVVTLMAVSACAAVATMHPALRPPIHDVTTQGTLALFHFAVIAAAALPLYVLLRSSVARVLELAPAELAAEALELDVSPSRALTRVRTRFLLAVAAPVAFIALGASLLAYAHVRAAAEEAERATAEALARGVLEPVAGSTAGREQAIAAAAELGIRVNVVPLPIGEPDDSDDAWTTLSYVLDDAGAIVRLPRESQALTTRTLAYALVVVLAALATGLLGARIGGLYSKDLSLARATLERTGALEVMTGRYSPGEPRFASVSKLLDSIGELGLRFREFAAAQERAIVAKETTERMRALFLAAMSHDLKAPLNSILGFASLVGRSPLTAEQLQSLAIIEQRGRELLHLIETILDAARAEAGQLEVALEETLIGDVIMSAVLDARDRTFGTDVAIVAEIQPGMPAVLVDTHRIVQALLGVIGTAVRFTEKGTVTVRATHGAVILIDVESAGRGLHPGEREKIFEAFKYPDRARRLGSLGLELSLARSIVELHRGAIDVDVPLDGGIVFHVRLPSGDAPVSVPRPSVRPRPLG
jgi:signal transduction histidine kinase